MNPSFDTQVRPFSPSRGSNGTVIVLDLDDVIANLRESLYRVLHRATGIDRHWRDWQHYNLCQHFALAKPVLERILIQEQALENCQPEPDAAAATAMLAGLDFELIIVTARAWHPHAEALTHRWLAEHGVHFHQLLVVPLGSDKLAALPDRSVALAIDDHPRNIRSYQRAGIATLMVERPWNAGCYAPRVESLMAAVQRVNNLTAMGA